MESHRLSTKTLVIMLLSILLGSARGDDFTKQKERVDEGNPLSGVFKVLGKTEHALQPYFVCDAAGGWSSLPAHAWHYSCKQSCMDKKRKTHVNITRVHWEYGQKEIDVYKVSTAEVCYTSHENIWGYCSHNQEIRPVKTSPSDKEAIPSELMSQAKGIKGSKTIVNSGYAECEYLSDNTKCARDYTITHKIGKTSKRSLSDDTMLNIYGDGIRVHPSSGSLYQDDVAWFWDPTTVLEDNDCRWKTDVKLTCVHTNTSEVINCPEIGYQYTLAALKKEETCKGMVYDIDGPLPFILNSVQDQKTRDERAEELAEGQDETSVEIIRGVNLALDQIEETYCTSSCDLISRQGANEDKYVINTPIGYWRMSDLNSSIAMMIPCSPTADWKIRTPTGMCHGKNHLVVENIKTHTTGVWNTVRDYITAGETCSSLNKYYPEEEEVLRKKIANNQQLRIDFWTGDSAIMEPPYDTFRWINNSVDVHQNPSWFSKVKLTTSMLQTKEDLSSALTSMVSEMKYEIMYNQTSGKNIRTLFFDEVITGLGSIVQKVVGFIRSIFSSITKIIMLVGIGFIIYWVVKILLKIYLTKRVPESFMLERRNVKFASPGLEEMQGELSDPITPKAPRKSRGRSRTRGISEAMKKIDFK